MAKKWVDTKGELTGFEFFAGGIAVRWFNDFYFNKLQSDLYGLVEQVPRVSGPLAEFLKDASEGRDRPIRFKEISQTLPPILFNIGKKINNQDLMTFSKNWITRREEYVKYLEKLESEAGDNDEDDTVNRPRIKNELPGRQYSQAEEIVNNILNKLPKKVAGEIRNAISRSPNKLHALQQELAKRNIQGIGEGILKSLVKTN